MAVSVIVFQHFDAVDVNSKSECVSLLCATCERQVDFSGFSAKYLIRSGMIVSVLQRCSGRDCVFPKVSSLLEVSGDTEWSWTSFRLCTYMTSLG